MTDDLVAFLRARLDEDEALATSGESWTAFDESVHGMRRVDVDFSIERVVACTRSWRADHIARHDPARVLAEVAAKRQLLELHGRLDDLPFCVTCDAPSGTPGRWDGCDTLRLLALPHAGHPGYRPEWAPDA